MDNQTIVENDNITTTQRSLSLHSPSYLTLTCGPVLFAESLLTIITIWRTPALHTNTFRCLASLAVAETILALNCFVDFYVSLPDVTVPSGLACPLTGVYYTCALLIIVHMSIVSVDRYIYIAHPFFYTKNMSKRCIRTIIALTWIGGLLNACGFQLMMLQDDYYIKCLAFQPQVPYAITGAIIYFSCFIVMFVFYFLIAHVAYKHKKAADDRRQGLYSPEFIRSTYRQHAAYKSVKFFTLMYGTFFVCKFPVGCMMMFNTFAGVSRDTLNAGAMLFIAGCFIHFGLTSSVNKQFGLALRKTVTDICKCCHKPSQDRN